MIGSSVAGVAAASAATPTDVSVQYNLHYGSAAIEEADVYRSTTAAPVEPGVLIVHGGGWHSGSKGGWSGQAEQLAAAGFVVVVANYQLATATESGFPSQLHELKAAVEWMRSDAAKLKIDPKRIGALGSSAGGNLVAMLATDADGPLDTGNRLRAAVTWSAILDLTTQPGLTSAMAEYVGCQVNCQTVLADASPLHHVSTGDTPIELFNSTAELVPLKTVQAMGARLDDHHVVHTIVTYPGHEHGVDYATQAMPATIAFLQQQLAA
jgi:acetyl esterase